MRQLLLNRRGDAYAWFAVLMLFVGLPLSSLAIDVTRLMYVRGHLHTATDAACQAAADALDVPHFISTGDARISPTLARAQARQVFYATLRDSSTLGFDPNLSVSFPGPRLAHCTSSAPVHHLIPMSPVMQAVVETTSEMRARMFR